MPRKIRDKKLDTRTARSSLKPSGKPYYRKIESGLHLGYRKSANGGTGKWVARFLIPTKKETDTSEREPARYELETIAAADDFSDADGVAILSFDQAQIVARDRMVRRAHTASGRAGPYKLSAAMDAYVSFLEANRKTADDARYRVNAFILPLLGADTEIDSLTADTLRQWHADLAKEAPRLRTKKGKAQQFREMGDDDETKRRRRASANRTLTVLKAALNRAWRDGKVESDTAWRRVEPFENVDAARVRYLSVPEAKRLLNACEPDFRSLVQAALQTGARYESLTLLTAADFNPEAGTVTLRSPKSGKPHHISLTAEGRTFFRSVCAGRAGSDPMFLKADGGTWGKGHQGRRMAAAITQAAIEPEANFHALRHTWASLAVMNGVPLLVVAKNLGHSDTRMVEKHYGHLAPSYIADAIREGAPRFGFKPDRKVVPMARVA